MALQDPSTYTAADLANPALDDATLRHIAQYRPDLRGYVLQHPACSPALAQMIHASAAPQQAPTAPVVPSVPQAPAGFNLGQAASTPGAQPFAGQAQQYGQQQPQQYGQAPQYGQASQQFAQPQAPQHPQAVAWAQWFQQNTGRQPGPADYQNAVAAGQLPHQVLMGMPAAVAHKPGFPAQLGALGRLLILIPIGAVIAIIGSFLPVISMGSYSFNYWAEGADGPIILVCGLITIAVAVLAIVKPAKWSYIVAGVVAILSQILLFISTISGISTSVEYQIALGPAIYVVLLGAIVVTVGAVVALVSARKL
ncbi:hypothetical protein ACQUSY_08835 [Microbacterium sp. YY-03]|uniref:variant leucine-rich repeat-containing protein n=1 Tax=Microbacterium sp. YY-03 TaxID=3421636 RepID=UPI003D175B95